MGKGSSPPPPPAPDYAGAAQATAAGNLEAARANAAANRVNQYTPYGSIEYSRTPPSQIERMPSPPASGKGGGGLGPDWLPGFMSGDSKPTPIPNGGDYQDGGWNVTTRLSPTQQRQFDQNNQINEQLGGVAQQGLGYVQSALSSPLQGQQYSGNISPTANQMVSNVNAPTLQGSYGNNANQIQTQSGANQQASGYVQDPNLLNQQVQNALYKNSTQYLDPQFQQSNAQLANRLANQGITQGSEAYNTAMLNAGNQQQQAYESARNQAVSGGINAAQGMFGMNLNQAQLGNSAAAQNNQMQLANQQAYNQALGQQNTQNMGAVDFANQAAQAQYGMGTQNAALQNQTAQQAYQQALQSGTFQNLTAQQRFAQAQALQQNPLNMLNAVRTGQQMNTATLPTQQNVAMQQGTAGPDMLGAATATGQYNQGIYNANQAANAGMVGGLGQMAMSGAMLY